MKPSRSAQANEKVDTVVQEYMDTLLADLFPVADFEDPVVNDSNESQVKDSPVEEPEVKEAVTAPNEVEEPISSEQATIPRAEAEPAIESQTTTYVPEKSEPLAPSPSPESLTATEVEKVAVIDDIPVPAAVEESLRVEKALETTSPPIPEVTSEVGDTVEEAPVETKAPVEKLFPNAPDWAQQAFDVLLFDVCGLKLAVPMDALGRIIKSEKELNQLIGRPSWFMGAYTEAEESLYVVDTAKYIMPEKGFDLSRDGYSYLIQLQRSKWALACQNVHTTVRLEPDQVKWRSQQGKRQWLAGTVIEQMCALVHVDTLVDILEAEAS